MTPYKQLWRIVDGAVADALGRHPDYLTPKGRRAAKISVVKRVTGTVLSFAEQSAKGRREPADKADGRQGPSPASARVGADASTGQIFGRSQIALTHCRIGKVTPKKWSRYRSARKFAATTAALRDFVEARPC